MTSADDRGHFDLDETAYNYRRYLEPFLFAPWAERFVHLVGLQPGQRVLDVAAGTGAATRAAAAAVGPAGEVIASDISLAMLAEVAREPDAGSAPMVTLESSASEIALPDLSVDVVLCQQGFQFMPDKVAVARELHRVLRPGGRIGLAVWTRGPWIAPLDDYEEFVSTHPIGDSVINVLPREQFRMLPEEVAEALDAGGFEGVSADNEELTVSWPSALEEARGILGTPFGRRILLQPRAEQEQLIAELTVSRGGDHVTTSVIATAVKR